MICPNCDHWNDISVEDMPYECDWCGWTLWADMLEWWIEFEEDDLDADMLPEDKAFADRLLREALAEDEDDACDCEICTRVIADIDDGDGEKTWDD